MKISIVTASYNCVETIQNCLDSVAKQSHRDIEHIVIDGLSNDGTLAILESKRMQLAVLLSESDYGIYDALNKGIFKSTGEVLGFLHADDFYTHDDVLANVANAFEDPDVCAVYGDLYYVKGNNTKSVVRHWRSSPFRKSLLAQGWMPPHPTLHVRREWYERIGGFDISYRIAADYLSILQFFKQPEFKSVYLPEVLVTMRLGGASNKTLKAIIHKSSEDWHILRSCGFSFFGAMRAIVLKNISKISQFWN